MSYINRAKIYCPAILVESQKYDKQSSVFWVSGKYGTWFLKYNMQRCKIIQESPEHISIAAMRFHNFLTYYCRGHFRNWFPFINMELSLLCVLLKRMAVGAGVGFKRYLRVRGVGYRFELLRRNLLTAKVGYTHLVKKTITARIFNKI